MQLLVSEIFENFQTRKYLLKYSYLVSSIFEPKCSLYFIQFRKFIC